MAETASFGRIEAPTTSAQPAVENYTTSAQPAEQPTTKALSSMYAVFTTLLVFVTTTLLARQSSLKNVNPNTTLKIFFTVVLLAGVCLWQNPYFFANAARQYVFFTDWFFSAITHAPRDPDPLHSSTVDAALGLGFVSILGLAIFEVWLFLSLEDRRTRSSSSNLTK